MDCDMGQPPEEGEYGSVVLGDGVRARWSLLCVTVVAGAASMLDSGDDFGDDDTIVLVISIPSEGAWMECWL